MTAKSTSQAILSKCKQKGYGEHRESLWQPWWSVYIFFSLGTRICLKKRKNKSEIVRNESATRILMTSRQFHPNVVRKLTKKLFNSMLMIGKEWLNNDMIKSKDRSNLKVCAEMFDSCVFALLQTKGENFRGEKDLLEAIPSLYTTLYISEKTSFKLFRTSPVPRRKQGKDTCISPSCFVHEISTDSWHQNQKARRWADTWCWGGVPPVWEPRCQRTAILCQFGKVVHWKNQL